MSQPQTRNYLLRFKNNPTELRRNLDNEFNMVRIDLGYQNVTLEISDVIDGLKDYCFQEVKNGGRDIEDVRKESNLFAGPLLLSIQKRDLLNNNERVLSDGISYTSMIVNEYLDNLSKRVPAVNSAYHTLKKMFMNVGSVEAAELNGWTPYLLEMARFSMITSLTQNGSEVIDKDGDQLVTVGDIRAALRKEIDTLKASGASNVLLNEELKYIEDSIIYLYLAANIDVFQIVNEKDTLLKELNLRAKNVV